MSMINKFNPECFIAVTLLIILGGMVILFLAIGHMPVDGIKNGQIIKIAKEGRFFPTYEASLIKGSISNGSGSFGGEFHFTISDDELLPIINEAIEKGRDVTIHYHSTKWCPLTSANDGCIFVDKVKVNR